MTNIACPACGSGDIAMCDDQVHGACIFMCRRCGESYAASECDIVGLGIEGVMHEWHGSYNSMARLEVRDD